MCAGRGINQLLRQERNPRILFIFGAITVVLGIVLGLKLIEWTIVILCIGLVGVTETLNSAIERTVDHTSTEPHPLARQAKDIAAGASLLAVLTAGTVGLILFLPKLLAL
ncbi:MAG: diacylglycerol kinase [Phycisphaerae bacterium]|jgi:diacylglycerol kinase|nr:MAG: diacylglycerol kinase [Phycisphaerae bacterium]